MITNNIMIVSTFLLLAALGTSGPAPAQADGPDRRPIPDPPSQGRPWTLPETKLPRFLVTATDALFSQGVPDPRGCPYRLVARAPTRNSPPLGEPVFFPAFLVPEIAGDERRFAIDWDGVLFQVEKVGAEADIEAKVRAWFEDLRESRQKTVGRGLDRLGARSWPNGTRALRAGMTLTLSYWKTDPSAPGRGSGTPGQPEMVALKRDVRFTPGAAWRARSSGDV